MNVAKYGLEDRVHIHQGFFFDPFETDALLRDMKADVIIGDVSGIADAVSHALGWYSDSVPTGGPDGTVVVTEMLTRAARYLAPHGRLYFPIAVDLSDGQRIMDCARRHFKRVVNALKRPFVQLPLAIEEMRAIRAAYRGDLPDFINIQGGRRAYWRGQIWKATDPA